jgi:hypothetical protein
MNTPKQHKPTSERGLPNSWFDNQRVAMGTSVVLPRLGKWLVVFALVVSTGGHWFALQSIAWVTMTVNFAQTDPLDVALKKTFDGQHPCRICKTVEQGRKSEQKQATLKVESKFEFLFDRKSVELPVPPTEIHHTAFVVSHFSRTDSPPTPPPRVA